ncbi:transglycosylase domain-containing protein [Arcanobacterium pinnipediorum]|uniref:Transglycosylase domain-containing protein n=1 Tax=Arcanobacterium pinnipediorum TaxID=1503041 RepID=A0ABY5AGK6_9ACTO|nr:transglycosylase domain-containing protein [Arcanobacterium pinnipediorum]USR79324.1 transglycosylase domain-containing protein [Arcanobacterium pinnipediorum]
MATQKRNLTFKQALAALLSFFLLCGLGGSLLAAMAIPVAAASGTAVNAITKIFDDLPTNVDFTVPSEVSTIVAADGTKLASFYSENRIVVGSENISQYIKDAAVSIEDQRFYQHNGIDAQGILGAAFSNLTGSSLAGGSTITQQYVKNALLEKGRIEDDDEQIAAATEQTIARKLNEARFAIAVENQMTKDEILTAYLNIAQFGPSQYGVEVASRYFFSKPAKDVTLEQAAMLAGITQAPGRWDPVSNPEGALKRRNTVLGTMLDQGYITQEQYDGAAAVSIEDMLQVSPAYNGCDEAGISANFCEYVVRDVLNYEELGQTRDERIAKLYRGGLVIHTTINPTEQQIAYDSIVNRVPVGDPSGIDIALSSIEPGTGNIRAMVQNRPFGNPSEAQPNATKVNNNVGEDMGGGAGFQPGSTFKIFTLVDWIAKGHSPYERLTGSRKITIPARDWKIPCAPGLADTFSPSNNDGESFGPIPSTTAAKYSVNTAFAQMSSKLDLCEITRTAEMMGARQGSYITPDILDELHRAGMTNVKEGDITPIIPRPSQVLGVNPTTPLSMASSVATLGADGLACKPHSFTKITDRAGNVLAERQPECRQVIDKDVARTVNGILQLVPQPGATGSAAQLAAGRPSAGKTGTTDSSYHMWYVGYTPQLASAVWTGHMNGNIPMLDVTVNGVFYSIVYGGTLAAPAFRDYMNQALADQPIVPFAQPAKAIQPPDTQAEDSKEKDEAEKKEQDPQSAVPSVIGMSEADAVATLQGAGYVVAVGSDYSDLPRGQVARQEVVGDGSPGSRVDLWLSIGPRP